MHRVLITGAGGGIGRALRETLRGVYPVLRVSDRVKLAPARPMAQGGNDGIEEVDQTDIADMGDRKSTRLNSSHIQKSRMPSSA